MKKKVTKRVRLAEPKTPVNPNTGTTPFARTPFPSAAGAKVSTPTGVTISAAPEANAETPFQSGAKMSFDAVGNSGTQIFGGYFSEEYLADIRGRRGAKQWDEMRRSESQIAMILNAIINPIKAANWEFEAADAANPDYVKHKLLIETCFKGIDYDTFKHEALTSIWFGFAVFEMVHNVVYNNKDLGTYNGLKALAFRSQKTIENWILEPKTGILEGVNQYTYSDLGGNVFIPSTFLLVITHSKEGDNYEGISILRPMLGAYKRKDLYLKLAAIGVERYAIGTPIGTVPKGKEKTLEFTKFQETLQNYTSHEASYIIVPEGWKIEIQRGDFKASEIKELIVMENTEFANAVVANFLALGMHGSGSSLALGSNLLEFFTTGIQSFADLISGCVNRLVIPNLVKLNYGEQPEYPKLKVTGISDKAGKELAETIKFLTDSRALDPDMPLKKHLRKLYKLPEPDPSTAVPLPAVPAGAAANYPKPADPVVDPQSGKLEAYNTNQLLSEKFDSVKLADPKYVKQFDSNKAELKEFMQQSLTDMYSKLRANLKTKYNGLKGSDKILAAKGMDLPGVVAYKSGLRNLLGKFAAQSIASARKQVPGKKNIKLAEEYDALPPAVRKLVDAQSSLVAETQAADIEKITFFQFTSEATATDDVDAILSAVDEKVTDSIDGSTAQGMSVDAAAGDALAHVAQQSALSFFFDPDVLDGIESFTFTNEDPVSDICQELAGQTFAPGDPDLDKFTPPLHHNCKSRLVPNSKGDSDNPEINRGVSVTQKALKSMTLCEHGIRKS